MEDSEKSMLLEELAAQEGENIDGSVYLSAEEADAVTSEADQNGEIIEDMHEAEEDGTVIAGTEGEIPEGIIEDSHEGYILTEEHQDDVEMPTTTHDPESSNDPGDDTQVSSLDGAGESMEVPDDTLESHEEFSGDQFISPTNALIVQNEPPHQLMEEADVPGEEQSGEVDAHAEADNDEGLFSFVDNTSGDAMAGQEEDELDQQDDPLPESSGDFEQEASLEEGEAEGSTQLVDSTESAAEMPAESPSGNTGDTMELSLDENEAGASNSTEGFSFLAGGNHLEGSLGGLEGKLVVGSDGTVHLLAGQDSLQGIQLMEGDDKPEGQSNGDDDNAAQLQQAIEAQLQEALLKQEEIKQEEENIEPSEPPGEEANAEGDALATLASAALDHQSPANGVKSEV